MCGYLFTKNKTQYSVNELERALQRQAWRGPDSSNVKILPHGIGIGHVRLAVIEPSALADQPLQSKCGKYIIIYNGEIYNHLELRRKFDIDCRTNSDTETILEGFALIGKNIFNMLKGMFSLVIIEKITGNWWAARDKFGIKPMYRYHMNDIEIISSETISIRSLVSTTISSESLHEWELIRRPWPGHTFFNEIDEVLPGTIIFNGVEIDKIDWKSSIEYDKIPSQDDIESALIKSIKSHEISDVANVSLLSGGIDSALITAHSNVIKAYTVGLPYSNEFIAANKTADHLGVHLTCIEVSDAELEDSLKYLIKIKEEPLYLPNEGLIYSVCNKMAKNEKVILTGEGADEIFLGYDRIFRFFNSKESSINIVDFLNLYCYSKNINYNSRMMHHLNQMWNNNSIFDFAELFFMNIHLPGLLRRMDSASMAASKEARVPFVDDSITNLLMGKSWLNRLSESESKIPLRKMCEKLGIIHPLHQSKIGFTTFKNSLDCRIDEYKKFRKFNLESLQWL